MPELPKKAYVIAVDMGYGHQRAAHPLICIATTPAEWNIQKPVIISANDYPEIPREDKWKWTLTRKTYDGISRVKGFPILGKRIFNLMNYFQKIETFYPRRNLSKATSPLKNSYRMIHSGLGKHLVEILNKNPLPIICTFPIPAFFAEEHGYTGDIYCLCTDTDIARSWAPLHPESSKIIYLTPTIRAKDRLMMYGVRPEKIFISGFPLPSEAIGDHKKQEILLASLERRIAKLDPEMAYRTKYKKLLALYFKKKRTEEVAPIQETVVSINKAISITFAIGGAGAQSDIGVTILKSFAPHIRSGAIKLNLVAGTSKMILRKFEWEISSLGLNEYRDSGISIIYRPNKYEYFTDFNKALIDTDILWTKPSELSFYAGLGLPIIMSPTLGAQEECNKAWLHMIGAGFEQYDPKYVHEWLFDWLRSGWLAEAAMNGFLNAPKHATENIKNLVLNGERSEIEDIHFA